MQKYKKDLLFSPIVKICVMLQPFSTMSRLTFQPQTLVVRDVVLLKDQLLAAMVVAGPLTQDGLHRHQLEDVVCAIQYLFVNTRC